MLHLIQFETYKETYSPIDLRHYCLFTIVCLYTDDTHYTRPSSTIKLTAYTNDILNAQYTLYLMFVGESWACEYYEETVASYHS